MFLIFTPFSFLFLILYLLLIFSLVFYSNFFFFWVFIEFSMLIFLGLSFSLFFSNVSSLIMYFLIQAVISINIFLFYFLSLYSLINIFLFFKLGIFPFFLWFLKVCYNFPNFIFFLVCRFQKLPILLIISYFIPSFYFIFFFPFLYATIFFGGLIALNCLDFRMLLLISSVINNAWLLIARVTSFSIFIFFLFLYFFNFFFVILFFLSFQKISLSIFSLKKNKFWMFLFLVISISGMPPFPLFFGKVLIVFSLFSLRLVNYLFLFILIRNVMLLVSYFQYLFFFYINVYQRFLNFYI